MTNGAQKILEKALEDLLVRQEELDKTIILKRRELEAAENEVKVIVRAVKEQRSAIQRLNTAPRSRSRGGGGSQRPWARREPAEGTNTKIVLDVFRSWGTEQISLGVLVQRSKLPANKVRPVLGDLTTRGYITRQAEGIYKLVEVSSDSRQ